MKKYFIILFSLISLSLTACSSTSEPTYSGNSIGQVSNVESGTIIAIEKVNIKGTHETGERVGAIAGGLGGAFAGGGSMLTHIAGSIGGAVVGGLAGAATQDVLTSGEAYQFIIKKPSGQTISVLQTDDSNLKVGDNVTILLSGNNTRIIPSNPTTKTDSTPN